MDTFPAGVPGELSTYLTGWGGLRVWAWKAAATWKAAAMQAQNIEGLYTLGLMPWCTALGLYAHVCIRRRVFEPKLAEEHLLGATGNNMTSVPSCMLV